MNAETAPVTSIDNYRENKQNRDGHHPVEKSVASRPETKEMMIGFDREKMRDRDAIQTFITTRDTLWNGGHSKRTLNDAIYEAAIAYDAIMITPLENWGSAPEEPTKPVTDLNLGSTSGIYDIQLTLPQADSSDELRIRIAQAKKQAEDEVKKWYNGRTDKDQKTLDFERNAAFKAINKKYKASAQDAHTFSDEEPYISYKDLGYDKELDDEFGYSKNLGYNGTLGYNQQVELGHVHGRIVKIKDQLDSMAPAIDAAYTARQDALAEGKTLNEAFDIGATEYKRVLKALNIDAGVTEPEKTEHGIDEARAIDAFNNVRDAYVPPGLRHGKFQHAQSLHDAAFAYEESLHQAHAAHEAHQNKPDTPTPTPASPTVTQAEIDSAYTAPVIDQTKAETPQDVDKTKQDENKKEKKQKMTSAERKERNEKRAETLTKFIKKSGRDAILAVKTFNAVGFVDLTHAALHKAGIPEAVNKSLDFLKDLPDSTAKEFRAAIRTIQLAGKLGSMIWEERRLEARQRKDTRQSEDMQIVSERVAKILTDLGKKHPDVVLYGLYDTENDPDA